MKTYNEMAERVFARMEEYEIAKKRRKKLYGRIGITACCMALVIAIGAIPLLKNNMPTAEGGGITEGGEPYYNGALVPEDDGEKDGTFWKGDQPVTNFPEQSGSESSTSEDPINAHLPFIGEGESISEIDYATFIESYPYAGDVPCYKLPAAGEVLLTIPLNAAIKEYGDDAIYRVCLRIYRDGKLLDNPQALKLEFARLSDLGYTAVYEKFDDGATVLYQLSLHATAEQLLNFVPNEEFGSVLMLYKEELHNEQG